MLDHDQAVAPSAWVLELYIIHNLAHQKDPQPARLYIIQRDIELRLCQSFRIERLGAVEKDNLDPIANIIAGTNDFAFPFSVVGMLNDVSAGLINRKLNCVNIFIVQAGRYRCFMNKFAEFLQALELAGDFYGSQG